MKLEDLRPEQRFFAERILYSVGRSPLDPIYAELIAEVVAIYDEAKDRLLKICEDQQPHQVLLFRGGDLYKRFRRNDPRFLIQPETGEREIFLLHREQVSYSPIIDVAAVQHCWREKFSLYGQSCKHCGALHYYSQNWQEMPDWLRQDDFNSRYGARARDNQALLDRLQGV